MKEIEISKLIIKSYFDKLTDHLENDVVIVGAGPSGLTAAYYLAQKGAKTLVIEKKLSTGGGIWGGAAAYNYIVTEKDDILNVMGIASTKQGDMFVSNAIEFATALTYKAVKAGAFILNLVDVEDIIVKENRVQGVVVNSTPILYNKMHVDPYCISAKVVIDSTGHPAELVKMLKDRKADLLPEGIREGFMNVEEAEKGVVEKTGEIFPGLFLTGMSVCSTYKLPRMGPIFGGMLESGKKAAEMIYEKLQNTI